MSHYAKVATTIRFRAFLASCDASWGVQSLLVYGDVVLVFVCVPRHARLSSMKSSAAWLHVLATFARSLNAWPVHCSTFLQRCGQALPLG